MYRQDRIWGIEIPRATSIGEGFYIGHYGGITISHKAKIGKNCSISQLVTIGVSGSGDKKGAPTIGDNVYIAPGAKIFGKITIGNNVKIGANAVVHKDIPDNAIVVLNPGFSIISYRDNS
jgi:serine O-acetyltransferase